MSREEFNALASEISNGVISEMRETEGLVLNEESIKKIEFNIHRELERLTQKYRTLTQ